MGGKRAERHVRAATSLGPSKNKPKINEMKGAAHRQRRREDIRQRGPPNHATFPIHATVRAPAMKCDACKTEQLSEASRFCHQCGAALQARAPAGDALVGKLIGNYQVLSVIGEGGMGKVYRAEQTRLKRPVCIKTLLPQFARDESVVQRFEREGVATAAMRHPNIVSVFDFGRTEEGALYIVMELIEGKTLRALLKEESPVAPVRALTILSQVLSALDEAHANNIVHRDLKPSNVLVSRLRDGTDLVKVVDFGIAKVVGGDDAGPGLTRTGLLIGTMGYMPPEQLLGEAIDGRADLYAAGVILWELLTGKRLFGGRADRSLGEAHLLEAPTSPSVAAGRSFPTALDAAVLRALEKSKEARFPSAQEFRAQLEAIRLSLEGREPTASPPAASPPTAAPTTSQPATPDATQHKSQQQSPAALHDKLMSWATSLPALAAQQSRRPIVAVSVELTGLGTLSSSKTATEVRTLLAELTSVVSAVVTNAHGHAQRLPGNALLGLFGLLEVRADDAERALHAGREMQTVMRDFARKTGTAVDLSAGVHLDHIVPTGVDHVLEDPALGELLAVARRLAGASRGRILVSPAVQRAVGTRARFEARSEVSEPGAAEYLPAAVIAQTPMVGRKAELESLRALAQVVAQRGSGGLLLVGAPGLGKSRLLDEAERLAKAQGLTVARARGGRFAASAPYEVAHELVLALCSEPIEGAEAPRSGITALSRFGISPAEVGRLKRVLGEVRGRGPGAPEELQLVDQALLVSVVQRVTRATPLWLLIDDVHLVDRATLELMERLMSGAATHPLGILAAARPQGLETLLPRLRRVELFPLSRVDHVGLIQQHLGGLPSASLVEFVYERAQGNPFFVQEIIGALQEQRAVDVRSGEWVLTQQASLPDSVALVVTARLARLTDNARRLLSWGAVSGRTFDAGLIAAAVDAPLDIAGAAQECLQRGLLAPAQRQSRAWHFPQSTVYEQVLALLPGPERRHIHERLGNAIERGASSGEENAFLAMARHFRQAERPRKALKYQRAAADQQYDRGLLGAAAETYQACLPLLQTELPAVGAPPEAVAIAWLEVGARAIETLCASKPRAAVELAERVCALPPQPADAHARAEALHQKAVALQLLFRTAEAEALLEEARQLSVGHVVGRAAIDATLASVWEARGELARAAELLAGALQALGSRTVPEHGPRVAQILNQLGRLYFRLGRADQAREYFEAACSRARQVENEPAECKALINLAVLNAQQKDPAKALRLLEQAWVLAERAGDGIARVRVRHNRALVLRASGDLNAAKADFEAALAEARELGWREGESAAAQALGQRAVAPPT